MTVASIASFRRQVRTILEKQQPRRHVIVLGVDGIPYDLACRTWRRARVTRARSVFPTTSATAWLTSLSGESVDAHGIPGVVFALDEAAGAPLIDVYSYRGPLGDPPPEDLFSDAAACGYTPVAIVGDLEDTHCTWRDHLLQRAHAIPGHTFYARGALDPDVLGDRIVAAVAHALASHEGPCLVWCFIDADRHIHHHGYDRQLVDLLERIDAIAVGWSREAVVIAHSDHGLVPTRQDPIVADAIERVIAAEACRMGGAGRTRWLYVEPSAEQRVREALARHLPPSVRVQHADELFAPGSRARRRVGSIVLIAEGEGFLAADGYRFEHGSLTERELDVAVAEWRA
ncbi:MAG: hypothetical protein IPQ07_41570 [Myxococcales bacterium]|nr:hypothetical protein [Myxococcales bacterium]